MDWGNKKNVRNKRTGISVRILCIVVELYFLGANVVKNEAGHKQ